MSEGILAREMTGRSYTVVRLGTVFGASPRMRLDLMVNTMTYRAVTSRAITVTGGAAWRPHVHCRDAAQAFVLAAEAPGEKVNGETFNVGSDSSNFTISEIAVMVANEVTGTRIEYIDAVEDLRSYRVSFDKIRHVLGFAARYRVEDGIREVRTLLERGEIDGEDERYSNLKYLKVHGFTRPRPEFAINASDVRESVAS